MHFTIFVNLVKIFFVNFMIFFIFIFSFANGFLWMWILSAIFNWLIFIFLGIEPESSKSEKMPPPKFAPIKKRKSKRSVDYKQSVIVRSASQNSIKEEKSDSDGEYGFDSQWSTTSSTNRIWLHFSVFSNFLCFFDLKNKTFFVYIKIEHT